MSLPLPHSTYVPVFDLHPIRPAASRELYLLQQRAATFQVELDLERQLDLQGIATLPIEWSDYLAHQRQLILDRIAWIESIEEHFASSLGVPHDAHATQDLLSISHTRPEQRIYPYVPGRTEGTLASSHANPTTFSEDDSPSPEAHTLLDPISSRVHGHADAPASPDERIHQSPPIAIRPPLIHDENARHDNSLGIESTRRGTDPRRVEQAHYQPGMFNGARSTTISGGVFYFIQGGVSSMGAEMLPPR